MQSSSWWQVFWLLSICRIFSRDVWIVFCGQHGRRNTEWLVSHKSNQRDLSVRCFASFYVLTSSGRYRITLRVRKKSIQHRLLQYSTKLDGVSLCLTWTSSSSLSFAFSTHSMKSSRSADLMGSIWWKLGWPSSSWLRSHTQTCEQQWAEGTSPTLLLIPILNDDVIH